MTYLFIPDKSIYFSIPGSFLKGLLVSFFFGWYIFLMSCLLAASSSSSAISAIHSFLSLRRLALVSLFRWWYCGDYVLAAFLLVINYLSGLCRYQGVRFISLQSKMLYCSTGKVISLCIYDCFLFKLCKNIICLLL